MSAEFIQSGYPRRRQSDISFKRESLVRNRRKLLAEFLERYERVESIILNATDSSPTGTIEIDADTLTWSTPSGTRDIHKLTQILGQHISCVQPYAPDIHEELLQMVPDESANSAPGCGVWTLNAGMEHTTYVSEILHPAGIHQRLEIGDVPNGPVLGLWFSPLLLMPPVEQAMVLPRRGKASPLYGKKKNPDAIPDHTPLIWYGHIIPIIHDGFCFRLAYKIR